MFFRVVSLTLLLAGTCALTGSAQPAPIRASASTTKALARLQWMLDSKRLQLTTSSVDQGRVDRIGQKVAAACRRPVPWSFYVSTDKQPNAFTLGEGVVVVTQGLLRLKLDDDELAGVLAHEVAHGSKQHLEYSDLNRQRAEQVNREVRQVQLEKLSLDSQRGSGLNDSDYAARLYRLQRRMEEAKRIADVVIGQNRFQREFSQEQEIEADAAGLRYTVAAGYAADGLERSLRKILEFGVATFGQSYSGEGLSHPAIQRRIDVLRRVQASMDRSGAAHP